MSVATIVAFCGIVFIAAVVQGISGFAFGIMVLMVLPYLVGYTEALVLAGMMGLFLSTTNAFIYRKHINWKWAPGWLIVSMVADLLSVLLLKKVGNAPIWFSLMGVMFIIMAIYLLWGQRVVRVKVNNVTMVFMAAFCGLITGCFGVGGPIMAAFYLEATNSKEEYLGTIQGIGVIGGVIDVAFRIANGMFTQALVGYTGLGLAFMLIGLLIAKRLVSRMDALTMRKIVCAVMAINGVVMLLR